MKIVRCCTCGKKLLIDNGNTGIHTCYDRQEALERKIDKLKEVNCQLVEALEKLVSILEIHMPPSDPKWKSDYLDKAKDAITAAKEYER